MIAERVAWRCIDYIFGKRSVLDELAVIIEPFETERTRRDDVRK